MAIELPDVEQEWTANVAPYIAAMAEMVASVRAAKDESLAAIAEIQAALDTLHGGDVSVGIDAAGATASAAAMDEAAAAAARLAADDRLAKESADMFIESLAMEDAALSRVTAAKDESARASLLLAGADKILAGAEADAAESNVTASDALRGIIGAMQGAGTATRFFGLSLSQLHWIVGVSAEVLAVTIPAIIAFGAGLDVAAQGAYNAANHMIALWTAAESMGGTFNTTMGKALGLKDALQSAQDAANPGVYELLGSAVNDAKAGMGQLATAGLQVVHMWDEFAARITVDMQSMQKSGEAQNLLGNMVSDLQELGQVFGNVGHAILNFAADMPGLAEVLLKIVDGISGVILWLSKMPSWLITGAMALEEFYRWGGLAASIISRIGLLLPMIGPAAIGAVAGIWSRLAGIMGSITGVAAQLVSGLGTMAGAIVGEDIPVVGALSGKLTGLSEDMSKAAGNTAMMGTLGLLAAAAVGAGIALDHFRNSAQQSIAAVNKAVSSASDVAVLNTTAQAIGTISQKMLEQEQIFSHYGGATQVVVSQNAQFTSQLRSLEGPLAGVGQGAQNLNDKINSLAGRAIAAIPGMSGLGNALQSMSGASQSATQADELQSQGLNKLVGTYNTVSGNLHTLSSAYHLSSGAAAQLAQEAGVNLASGMIKLGRDSNIAGQMIENFVQGLHAMSAPAGVVGNDMEALGIQSQLAGTKVSQLNQAWDAWMSSVTGTMADFSQVQTALQGMGADASAASASLTGSIGSISRSASGMTYTLKGMGADAMQSWQQLTSALNQGNSALDQLRTGMAEDVVTGGQFKSTVQGLVGEFIPFVAGNKTATEMLSNLANEAGGPVTTSLKQLEEWAGVKGPAAAKQFADGMNNASQAMGQMSKVAQNLSAVVSSDLDAALAQSITTTSGVSQAVSQYAHDLSNAHTPASVLHSDLQKIAQAMAQENKMTAEASKGLNEAGKAANGAAGDMKTAAYYANALAKAIEDIPSTKTVDIQVVSSQGLHGIAAAGAAAGHASGTPNAAPGLAIVGEQGPELMMMHGGEAIFNATETARMLSGIPSAVFGATGGHRASSGGGGGGGGGGAAGGVMEAHLTVMLDGQQIHSAMQSADYKWQTRNSGVRSGLSVPGRRVG